MPPSAIAIDAPPTPVRKTSPFKNDSGGRVTGKKDLGVLHIISGDFIKNGGGYEGGPNYYFVGKDGTRNLVGPMEVFNSLYGWSQAYIIAARRSDK